MPNIELETPIDAPPMVCFDLSRNVGAHMASMDKSHQKAVAGITNGPMVLNDQVTWEARHLGFGWRMTSQIVAFDSPRSFTDQMIKGPFGRWRHVHRFEPQGRGTLMVDEVDYRSPFGPLGWLVDSVFLASYMRGLLVAANKHLKMLAESASAF